MCISEASVSRVLGDMRNVRQGRSGGQGDASGEGRVGCEGHRTGQGRRVPPFIAACGEFCSKVCLYHSHHFLSFELLLNTISWAINY